MRRTLATNSRVRESVGSRSEVTIPPAAAVYMQVCLVQAILQFM